MNTSTDLESSKLNSIISDLLLVHLIDFDSQSEYFKNRCISLIHSPVSRSSEDIIDRLKNYHDSVALLKVELPNVDSNLIDEIGDYLLDDQRCLYWEKQSEPFKQFLKSCLENSENAEEIIEKIKHFLQQESRQNLRVHDEAGFFGTQRLNSSIGCEYLQDETILRLTGLINPLPEGVDIFASVNRDRSQDNSVSDIITYAKDFLDKPLSKHAMFAVGNGHWYWVTISKTENQDCPYSVEVFDPYGSDGDLIYSMLQDYLPAFEKKPFLNESGLIQPQRDGHSCGYHIACFAHHKIKQIDPSANCNAGMIEALKINDERVKGACIQALQSEQPNQVSGPLFKMSEGSVFNRRGVQYAMLTTFIAEALTFGMLLVVGVAIPLSIKLCILLIVAYLSFVFSNNNIEPIVYPPQSSMT